MPIRKLHVRQLELAFLISCIPDFPLKHGRTFYREVRKTGNYRKSLPHMHFADRH
jgi:hypothetical protein